MDLYLKSFLYRKMSSPLSEKSDSQLQLFLSTYDMFVVYIFCSNLKVCQCIKCVCSAIYCCFLARERVNYTK